MDRPEFFKYKHNILWSSEYCLQIHDCWFKVDTTEQFEAMGYKMLHTPISMFVYTEDSEDLHIEKEKSRQRGFYIC